jgi:uncharacterized membrane protein
MGDATFRPDDAPAPAAKHDLTAQTRAATGTDTGGHVAAAAVTINRPVAEVYRAFRDFARWPSFMENVVSIDQADGQRWHWVVKAPGGRTVEWDARVTDEQPERLIAWESEDGADVPNSGRVQFRDAGQRGTVVTATILWDPPLGIIGKVIAKMFQREPNIQARRDLNRFKQLLETGEVATPAKNRQEYEEMGL